MTTTQTWRNPETSLATAASASRPASSWRTSLRVESHRKTLPVSLPTPIPPSKLLSQENWRSSILSSLVVSIRAEVVAGAAAGDRAAASRAAAAIWVQGASRGHQRSPKREEGSWGTRATTASCCQREESGPTPGNSTCRQVSC